MPTLDRLLQDRPLFGPDNLGMPGILPAFVLLDDTPNTWQEPMKPLLGARPDSKVFYDETIKLHIALSPIRNNWLKINSPSS
jgi:hypothetical protein